jgi:hypothetical protein
MGATLSDIDKARIVERLRATPADDREYKLELMRLDILKTPNPHDKEVLSAVLKYAESANTQIAMRERAAATPLEIDGQRKKPSDAPADTRTKEIVEPATFKRAKPVITIAVVTVGGGLAVAYVVIPALIAIETAVTAFIALIAPFLAMGAAVIAGLFVAVGMFSGGGQKKTDCPQSGGGQRIVNIHVNQGDGVTINHQ